MTAKAFGLTDKELLKAVRRANELDRLASVMDLSTSYKAAIDSANAVTAFDASSVSAARAALKGFDFEGVRTAQEALKLSGLSDAQQSFAYKLSGLSISEEIAFLTKANRSAYHAVSEILIEQTRSIQAALALTKLPDLGAASRALTALNEPQGYFEEIRKQLRVANPAAGLAALAAVQTTALPYIEMRDILSQVTALRPGFQMTAALGLTVAATRGVTADVLRLYEVEPDAATPVFSAAVRTAHVADTGEARDDEIAQLWATIDDLQALACRENDPVRRYGLLEILNVIGLLVSLLIGGAALYGDHQGRIADQRDREQQAAFEAKMQREQHESRAEAAKRYVSMRYIATDGPLRTEPDARGLVLQYVYAGQLAIAKDQRAGWVLVEVFSYASEQSVIGWLPVRRLKVSP